MKKSFAAIVLVLLVALSTVGQVSAQKNKINLKGEVVSVGSGSLTVESNKGDTYVITIPDGINVSDLQVGDSILVKASAGEGDTWIAESIKLVGNGNGKAENMDGGELEGFKYNSAFCADGKQEKSHPLAPKIAERFGISEETVMGYFCEGYSMGAIMLAIKTSQMDDISISVDDLLASRENGQGWGQIWKGLGLIGSEKDGQSPPGLLKKPDHAGPKNKK